MSAVTDANDRETLERIARNPGCKRKSPANHSGVPAASVARLIQAGLVKPPSTNGKLFLTDKGRAKLNA